MLDLFCVQLKCVVLENHTNSSIDWENFRMELELFYSIRSKKDELIQIACLTLFVSLCLWFFLHLTILN